MRNYITKDKNIKNDIVLNHSWSTCGKKVNIVSTNGKEVMNSIHGG